MRVHQRATRSIPAARYARRSSNSGLMGRYVAKELRLRCPPYSRVDTLFLLQE